MREQRWGTGGLREERRRRPPWTGGGRRSGETGTGFPAESEESLLRRAVSVLHGSFLHPTSRQEFQYSRAILVENQLFLSELKAFARAKEAAGYSREELQETFAFLLFDKEEEAREVCRTGLRVNSSSISTLGDPAKGVYIPSMQTASIPAPGTMENRDICHCKLIKGKVRVIPEDYTTTYTCPSPGYDCHVAESRELGSAAPSPCQAFEQSQYYVYEVSGGSPAQRPRQVCPYILLCCQYRDPKDVAMEDLPERDHQGLYCPWRGALTIQGKLLCNITLRTPYSSSLPAQLPPKLDISHVMGLSDLRKKLPEAAFGKRNYTGNEVCFQGVYSSLYEVEISDEDQHKMDQLVENLKEKDLAIIKYLQDQGVFILLTPSDGSDSRDPLALLALFLFSSPRSLCPRAEKRAPRAIRKYGDRRDIPLKVASLLPGLRYALRKAGSSPWNDSVSASTRIKQHFQEYARLGQDPEPEGGDHLTFPPAEEGSNPFQRFPEKSLCQLRHYLQNPKSYTLKLSAATGCLKGDGQSLLGTAAPSLPPADPRRESPNSQGGAEPEEDSSDPWGEQGRRKSTRLLMSRKRGSAEAPAGDDGRSPKRKSSASPSSKRAGSAGNSKGSLLKLANLQLPHGRKRGAEVLAARIVRKPPDEPAEKGNDAPDAPDSPNPAAKRAKAVEIPDTPSPVPDLVPVATEVPCAERAPSPVKNKEQESPERDPSRAGGDDDRAGSELQEPLPDLPAEVSPQSHGEQSQGNEFYPAELGNECNSHGLNLLADLALGSCVSLYILQDTEGTPVSPSTEVVPVPSSAEVIPVPYSPSSDSSQDDEGISVSYSSGMVPVSHTTGVTSMSHRTGVTPMSHNTGVIPVSHRTEVFTVSHRTEVIPASHSTGVTLVSHSTGVTPVSPSTGVTPASHSTGVILVSHSSSSYSPPGAEVILVSQSPSNNSPQDAEVIPVSHSTEVIPASSSPSSDSPQDAEDAQVIPEVIPVSPSPPSASPQEQQGRPQLRSPRATAPAPDPKHQRPGRRTASAGRAAPNQALPAAAKPGFNAGKPGLNAGKPGLNGSAAAAAPEERTSGIPIQSGVRPGVWPGWAGERERCAVALEHSYALAGPLEQRRRGTNPPGTNPPGTPTSGAAPTQNGTGRTRPGPLVGKVLPFRRQPGASRPPWVPEGARSRTGSARDKEDFAKCHTVRVRGKSLKVTLQWEGQYAHNLDTRYTNNILERSVIRALHGPWDCNLPETVEDMKLILHTWVALFYRRPSAQLNSSRKVVEHRDPNKFVLLNSSDRFWDLSDDDLEPRGRKTCPADSRSDPDQTPSSSVDPGTPRKRSSHREKGRPGLRSDAGGVDSTVSSSSGELPGEEEEPSSTSCPESVPEESVPEGVPSAEESLDEGEGQPGIPEDVSSVTAEEPPDAAIAPGPSEEPGRASERPAVPGMENSRSPAPNSSAAPCTDSQDGIPGDGEQLESGREAGAGRGSPRDTESAGDARHGTEVEDNRDRSKATSDPWDSMPLEASPGSASHPRHARNSVPLEASPRSANLAGASEEGLESRDPFGHLEKEEGELEEDKEENEEDFEEVLGPVDLVLSESSDTEMESEHSDQKTGSSPLPEDFGAPREDSVPSPSSLASPYSGSSTLVMSDRTWTGNWSGIDSPGLPGERAPSVDELPEPWDAPATPCSETGGIGAASPARVGSPRDSGEMIPPDPGLFHGAQPDSVTGSPEPAGEVLGNDLEQKDRDYAPSAESWEPADVGSPRDSGETFPPDPGLFHEAQPVSGAAGETLGNDLEQKDRDHVPAEERWESSDVGSPRDSGEMFPPDPGLFHGAQPDSVTGSSGAAGETLGNDLEQKDRDHVPAAERGDPARNSDGLESLHSQGLALPLSPHSSSACLTSPNGSIDPRAAPEDQETTAGFPSPSRRDLGGSSRFSREQGDDVGADPGEPNQERSEVLGEEEPGSPCSNGTGVLDDPMGAGGGQDFPLDYGAAGGDPGAGEGEDVCPGAENSPRSDRTDMEMGGDTPQEPEMPLHPPPGVRAFLLGAGRDVSHGGAPRAAAELPKQSLPIQPWILSSCFSCLSGRHRTPQLGAEPVGASSGPALEFLGGRRCSRGECGCPEPGGLRRSQMFQRGDKIPGSAPCGAGTGLPCGCASKGAKIQVSSSFSTQSPGWSPWRRAGLSPGCVSRDGPSRHGSSSGRCLVVLLPLCQPREPKGGAHPA
ncbi:uncharacterized protein LOC116786775 [Chiroxiphia lanceolata]|uniref:uncharacterized protein LOC116786775 n=1 Tax=Chiroxiphia lanceolata TaxID=296741 RepID=UPI0013CECD1C|nr:uncharacterized protein LOC116786775 [Chiroxiphia lanceolata]